MRGYCAYTEVYHSYFVLSASGRGQAIAPTTCVNMDYDLGRLIDKAARTSHRPYSMRQLLQNRVGVMACPHPARF